MHTEDKDHLQVRLSIDNENGYGIKFEAVEEFAQSYFRDNYYDAFFLTWQIIKQNEYYEVRKDKGISQEKLYNVITFCGERGAGKTSVMNSFIGAVKRIDEDVCESFIRNYEERREQETSLWEVIKTCEFVCLDEIDASLLEKTENILEMVLAKMFQKFHENTRAYNKNSLWEMEHGSLVSRDDVIAKFEEIYRCRYNLLGRDGSKYEAGRSSVEIMKNLSGSLDIREKMQELVPMYLQALRADGYRKQRKKQYLVISIDDLDMNENGYEMLEEIHRYLMIPGVIIYLAISKKELQAVCEQHYKKTYKNPEKLALAYFDKVLPFSQSIYLPTLLNSNSNIEIKPDNLPVKDSILRKIVRRTRVCYDGCGLKTHFYEAGNLRTLVNLYYYLDGMEKLKEEMFRDSGVFQKYCDILDNNIEKIKNDVANRMAAEKLKNPDHSLAFQEYYEQDATRRGMYFTEWIINHIQGGNYTGRYEKYGYNYGELLQGINILGKDNKTYKPLIHCILAMETITLTQIYMHAFYGCGKDRDRYFKKWQECISGSVCGSWGNQIIPAVRYGETIKYRRKIGYIKDKEIDENVSVELKWMKKTKQKNDTWTVCNRLIKEENLVEAVEMLSMFITENKNRANREDEDIYITRGAFKPTIQSNDNNDKSQGSDAKADSDEFEKKNGPISIAFSARTYTFDVLGFVVNSMNYEEHFRRIDDSLLKALKIYCSTGSDVPGGKTWDKIEELFHKHSMKKRYEEWHEKYNGMAMPVYSADIMYNVLKRVKRERKAEFPKDMEYSDMLVCIKDCYLMIKDHFAEQDKFYRDINDKKCYIEFEKAFLECPFMKNFLEAEHSKLFKELFNNFIKVLTKDDDIRDKRSTPED